jgi:general secretion pathway protein G
MDYRSSSSRRRVERRVTSNYIERVQADPWGREYLYASDGRQFHVRSLARDAREGGDGYDADVTSDDV